MHIKQITTDELDLVTELFSGYRDFYQANVDPQKERAFLTERLQNNESIILCGLQDDQPIAFAQIYFTFSSVGLSKMWIINDLYVAKSHRNQGIGKIMLQDIEQRARDAGIAVLKISTQVSNEAGNYLYPALGFNLNTTFNNYGKKL